jgi:energy-coupling factor transport system ATP-binding protein
LKEGQLGPNQLGAPTLLQVAAPQYQGQDQEPLLEIESLAVSYDGVQVLDELNLELFPGELVSLLGDNGSGKSTLLLSLLKFVERDRGQIRFLDRELESYQTRDLGREIGVVFQNPDHQIFGSTVWEEAVLGAQNYGLSPGEYQPRTHYLLERAGLSDRLQDHPYQLSYGEKRRLNLISILSYQPRLLLLDEIFIGQDLDNARFLLQLLVTYVEGGSCVLMVNHNPAYYPLVSTRLLFLQGGKFIVDSPLQSGLEKLKHLGLEVYLPGGGA